MTKIQVPKGMLQAGEDAYALTDEDTGGHVPEVLEAAIQWLSEHPIVPTLEQVSAMTGKDSNLHYGWDTYWREHIRDWLIAWQRLMFLAEPEIPAPVNSTVFLLEELLDLAETLLPMDTDRLAHIKQVLEAERSKG